MKRILLGSTALVTAGLLAGAASAADPIKASVAGYYRTGFGFYDSDQANRTDTGLMSDVEIWFRGSTKLDNGIEVGVMVELEAETSADQVDEHHVYFRGSFGEIRIGKEDDVRKLFANTAPWAAQNFAVNSPFFTAAPSTQTTTANMENDSTKIIYFTPSFSGFRLGASYTPNDNRATSSGDAINNADNDAGQRSESVSVAAAYAGSFGDVKVSADIGYTTANPETGTLDPNIIRGGLVVSVAGFDIGGSYERTEDYTVAGKEVKTFDLGIAYSTGPWKVGLAWLHSDFDIGAGNSSSTCSAASTKACDFDAYVLGASYNMGAGVWVDAAVEITKAEGTLGSNTNNDTSAFFIGTRVAF